jgi:hypothetical protein
MRKHADCSLLGDDHYGEIKRAKKKIHAKLLGGRESDGRISLPQLLQNLVLRHVSIEMN